MSQPYSAKELLLQNIKKDTARAHDGGFGSYAKAVLELAAQEEITIPELLSVYAAFPSPLLIVQELTSQWLQALKDEGIFNQSFVRLEKYYTERELVAKLHENLWYFARENSTQRNSIIVFSSNKADDRETAAD